MGSLNDSLPEVLQPHVFLGNRLPASQPGFPFMEDLPLFAPAQAPASTELIVAPETALVPALSGKPDLAAKVDLAPVLSPSQVRTFLDCQARWWFKYGLQLPEHKNSSLALGLAIHRALEVNFREKLETHEDLDTAGVVMLFRDAWMEQAGQTEFMPDEDQGELRRVGERLVTKYMDLLDVEGCLIDIKTAALRPSHVSADYAFQLATYRQITPGASGQVRIDSLVKTQAPQIAQMSYTVGEPDLRATHVLFPMVRQAMNSGMYCPNRQSLLCSHKHCPFWNHCEQEFGGTVRPS
jgi:hypothetical protein